LTAAEVAARFDAKGAGQGKWAARCPAHEDRVASLSIAEGGDGKTLIHCFAGCDYETILSVAGLGVDDLFAERREVETVSAVYSYRAVDGTPIFEVVRYAPKRFQQRRPDGNGGWLWKLGDAERVPYNLPELAAAPVGARVWVCEGEKDCHSVMAATGEVAVTVAGGAGQGSRLADYASHFLGKYVVVVPDDDAPGAQFAEAVTKALAGRAASINVLKLPFQNGQKDVSDWLLHHSGDELRELADRLDPAAVAPVMVSMATVQQERISWLWPGWIPFGAISIIEGDPGLGKSMLSLGLAAAVSSGVPFRKDCPGVGPANVVLMTTEDSLSQTVRPRLVAAGANLNLVHALDGVRTKSGVSHPYLDLHTPQIIEAIRALGARLVVIDPLAAYCSSAIDMYRDQDVRRVLNLLARAARDTGAAIVILRHLVKPGTSGGNNLYRGGGSIGIIGAARSCIGIRAVDDYPGLRTVDVVKSNLAPKPPMLSYRIADRGQGPVVRFEDQ
jgi:archaellum biogenesis ATPase FlaH